MRIKELGLPDNWLSVNGPDGHGANVVYYDYNRKWRVYHIVDHGTLVYDETFIKVEDAFDYAFTKAEWDAKYNKR